ncbi:MAG: peptidoglycan editing factor PgeF [Pseudomonadota bacterium]
MDNTLSPLLHDTLSELPGVRHGFFTRQGGVSGGIYAGLNTGLGSRDEQAHVMENRERIRRYMGGTALLTVHQHHSATSIRTRTAWDPRIAPRADAIVTRTPGLTLVAQAADCGPILFADAKAGVVGAAHAGWKGALYGVLESTVDAMEQDGADRARIVAVLGPSISGRAYEVGPEFIARFVNAAPTNTTYFNPSEKTGHAFFDLPRYTLDRLARLGLKTGHIDRCTYGEPELFFSYRRATHQGEADYGRLASAIMLT